MHTYERGMIYYVHPGKYNAIGSEQNSGRPAIIVSNNTNNAHSPVLEVVYLTTKLKTKLPTHVAITSSKQTSTALCESIYSVSKNRIGKYLATCTEEEMKNIDKALLISLGLPTIK